MRAPVRELVIVGAGPAGVSAALWAKSRHLDTLLVEQGEAPGGQLHAIHFEPREIAGWLAGDGHALAGVFARQLAEGGVPVRYGSKVRSLEVGGELAVRFANGERLRARAVLVATGARRRRLGVPGEREFEDRGVSYSATRDREQLAGRDTVVVGGGDAATENALTLAALGGHVTLVARGPVRARAEFRERLSREPRVRVLEHTNVVEISGEERVQRVRARGPAGDVTIPCEAVVVKVGVLPNTEWCRESLPQDADGFLLVDARLATPAPGVWAAVTRL